MEDIMALADTMTESGLSCFKVHIAVDMHVACGIRLTSHLKTLAEWYCV